MQAAIGAFDRGHRVILVELENGLGGILRLTDQDYYKQELRGFKDFLIVQNIFSYNCTGHFFIRLRS